MVTYVRTYVHDIVSYMYVRIYTGDNKEKLSKKPDPVPKKKPQRESLLEPNRSQNVAIAKKRLTLPCYKIREAITL